MRLLVASLFLLVPAAALTAAPDPGDDCCDTAWKDFSPKGGGFKVKLPGKPEALPVKEQTVAGKKIKRRTFVLKREEGGGYVVAYTTMPAGYAGDDPDAFLKGIQGVDVKDLDGELVTSKKVKLGDVPGRDYTIKSEKGMFRVRMYLTDTMLYALMLLGDEDFVTGPEAKKFMASFELLE